MIDSKEVVIDDRSYTITLYSARKSDKLFCRLFRYLGETATILGITFVNGVGSKSPNAVEDAEAAGSFLEKDMDPAVIGRAVQALADKLSEEEYEKLIADLLETTMYQGHGVMKTYDALMAGRMLHKFKLLGEVVKFQWGDFLAAAEDVKERASALRAVQGRSIQARSIGQPGG